MTNKSEAFAILSSALLLSVPVLLLMLLLIVILLTGPAPITSVVSGPVSLLPLPDGTIERITEDEVLSMLEISEALCMANKELEVDASFSCWITDHWTLPKSIRWPLNH